MMRTWRAAFVAHALVAWVACAPAAPAPAPDLAGSTAGTVGSAPTAVSASAAAASPAVALTDEASVTASWAQRAAPAEVGLDRAALETLVSRCETTDTHALIVIAKGRTVVERRFGKKPGPIELMSVTKGIVGLAVGKLIADGKIRSLDVPLSTYFHEWKEGKKAKVTLRHLLTHTSGLAHKPAAGELTRQKDRLAYVRALPIVSEPGETFSYNNEATQLLAEVVRQASGMPLDAYVRSAILKPLGVADSVWAKDGVGTPAAAWGLGIDAGDLAKIGAMLLDRGRWDNRQIIPETWVSEMTKPVNAKVTWHGLLTWLRYDGPYKVQTPARRKVFADAGFGASDKLASLDGKRFESYAAYWLEAGALLDGTERTALASLVRDDRLPVELTAATFRGFDFNGWLGQYLLVLPDAGVVAVRLRSEPAGGGDDADNAKNGVSDFVRLVMAAAPAATPAGH